MKRMFVTLFGVTLAAAVPATAQHAVVKTKTTVTKVHGPLKILPHHKHKYCRSHWAHHHRVTKCWYH